MAHKKSLEALDQCLKDFAREFETLWQHINIGCGRFSGKTYPIIPRSTPADEMNAFLKNSNLWAHVKNIKINYKYACPIAKR